MKYILILACCLLTSCIITNPNPIYSRNSCLPNALSFRDAYKVNKQMSKYRWSRILGYGHHAFCTYSEEGKIYIYDVLKGSRETRVTYEKRNDKQEYLQYVANMGLEKTEIVWITNNDK